ncbi:hypothetical protein M3P05_18715 [Sansalvadorimonas sp. 2012CJ34-2]|uniref:Uncharacterized protein n=1 Tax=Parendozoicomonas callyspongiae TaxID=2942213 RepID=A0ABT0PL11_9GAMM|nr:hypothetical protein [Sansalvadorimonas sp. 2012CJ34-2]MCL6271956.1 hypothetical protein [Sansalvadorimonas sp. 2012CJ34-2]
MSSVEGIEPGSSPSGAGINVENQIQRLQNLIGHHGGRSVTLHRSGKKEFGHPIPRLSYADKKAIRKQIREARKNENKNQAEATAQAPNVKANTGNIYDIVVEVATLAEQIDANYQPELAQNMARLLSNLLKMIDEFEEREAERKDEEREQDRRDQKIREQERAQKKHENEIVENNRRVQEKLAEKAKKQGD